MNTIEPSPAFIQVCELIAEGASARTACEKSGWTILHFTGAENIPALREQYAHATDHRADVQFEGLEALLEDVRQGRLGYNEARLIIDTRKWQMGKQRPKKYSDRPEVDIALIRPQLTREEQLAQLSASGLRIADVFASLTRQVEAEPVVLELPPAQDDVG